MRKKNLVPVFAFAVAALSMFAILQYAYSLPNEPANGKPDYATRQDCEAKHKDCTEVTKTRGVATGFAIINMPVQRFTPQG